MKPKLSAIVFAVLMLSGCGSAPQAGENAAESGTVVTFSPDRPQKLQFDVSAKALVHGAHVSGRTNLPDGTQLVIELKRGPSFVTAFLPVKGGRFETDLYPNTVHPLPPGDYHLSIDSLPPSQQPPEVKAQLGEHNEAIISDLVKPSPLGVGNVIQYGTTVPIDGAGSAEQDKTAQQTADREFARWARQNCETRPALVESVSGRPQSDAEKAKIRRDCLRELPKNRQHVAP